MNRAPLRALAAAAALLVLAACADDRVTGPTGPNRQVSESATAEEISRDSLAPAPDTVVYGGEQEYEDIAREVPGYAGHWYDENGDRVVQLTDLAYQDQALRVIDSRPQPEPADGEKRTGATRFVQVRYDFATLRDWRNRASDAVLNVPGAVFTDLNEVQNRVGVGIADESARAGVEEQLKAAGVPLEATLVEVVGKPEQYQTLQNFFRPLQSGYQIQNQLSWTCTLGVPAVAGWPSYLTNSHCTQAFWWNTGTAFYQHVFGAPFFIGNEVSDPPGWACWPWVCRWSDAARIAVPGNVPAANQIARTGCFGVHWAPGCINTAGIAPFNVLNPPQWWPWPFQWVDKVGRTTGWTKGVVTHTCINIVMPPNRQLLCQYLMTNMAGPGDSGSPVFLQFGGNAQVTGMLWGGIVAPGFQRSIFSARGAIFADLGA
jgi:hypothetical protein